MEVNIKLNEGTSLPVKATPESIGVDLKAKSLKALYNRNREVPLSKLDNSLLKGYFSLRAGERALVGTGIWVEIPVNHVLDVRSRSGNALKKGLVVANSPGTIDPDYRGEVCVILHNTTKDLIRIDLGDAIGQAVLLYSPPFEWKVVDELTETQRGEGGFGHTGK